MESLKPCVFVIFGATGDLTHRKLLPAIYNLALEKRLPAGFAVVAIGRRSKTEEDFRQEARESILAHSRFDFHDDVWDLLAARIFYQTLDFFDDRAYAGLKVFLESLDKGWGTGGNRIFYLATAPDNFGIITAKLQAAGMACESDGFRRVVIEKPFGSDLASARLLNRQISGVFHESSIYRIDHYLGKEMLQNMTVIRFANAIFEPLWNHRFIDCVQITSSETVGVEGRGPYYESSGALRDMVQNHLLQILALTAMEPPVSLDTDAIRDEKVKVLRCLQTASSRKEGRVVVRGQYGPGVLRGKELPGYRQEGRVSPDSGTETYVALKLFVNNFRWAGVPFYLRTGKRMPRKTTEVVIRFKALPVNLFGNHGGQLENNLLVIKVQPREGIFLMFNAKKPGMEKTILPVQMDFCQNCTIENNSPESYERLIYDMIRGDSTLFTRWDEVEASWRFADRLRETWSREEPAFPNYAAGSWGPEEAQRLVEQDGRTWIDTENLDQYGGNG